MSNRVENINRSLIDWAIIRSGNNLEDFYAQNPKVEAWAKGEKSPTVKQLEKFTHKVHVPFGYLFLPHPPEETIPMPFFRTGKKTPSERVSLNVFHTVQIIQDRQDWLTEYLEELEFPDLNFVGKFSLKDNYKTIVEDIRNTLELNVDWAAKLSTWEEALNYLANKIEDAGIIVTFNGVVGNNTSRVIDVEECRGFVLVNQKAPFLFVNNADAKAAQMFTIVHELAHIWLGESAGFNNKNMLPADDPIELLCDKVAAEFLVPEDYFRLRWNTSQNFNTLSRIFKVSPIVIGRRAMDLNLVSRPEFFAFYNEYMKGIKQKKEGSPAGGNFFATAKKRVSVRFASLVNNAVKENRLLYRDAYKLTNLKGDTYNKFVNEYLYM